MQIKIYKERFKDLYDLNSNIDSFEEIFRRYTELNKKIDEGSARIEEIRKDADNDALCSKCDDYIVHANRMCTSLSNVKGVKELLENHPIVLEYLDLRDKLSRHKGDKEDCIHFFDIIWAETFEFVLLHDNAKKYILELTENKMIDITDYDSDLANFMIECMKKCYSLFEITPADLPFLMAIREDMCYEPDLSDMDPMDRDEERYLTLTGIPNEIRREYQETKKREAENKKPLDISPLHKEKLWDEFIGNNLNDEEFWLEYYRLLIAFGHDVEKLYIHASEDRKQYVIEAYHYFSSEADWNEHFRVSSPLIHEEVLKIKHLKK